MGEGRARALAMLAARAAAGDPLRLWLRDDDAVAPGPALDRLLALALGQPLTLAVIPAPWNGPPTGEALAAWLDRADPGGRRIHVALHGWSHRNHAPAGEKKQELGAHRPVEAVMAELRAGKALLAGLHGARALPMLVPPWNRIALAVAAALPGAGFTRLSTFGPEREAPGPRRVNTHLDIIDWRAGGRGRDPEALWSALAALGSLAEAGEEHEAGPPPGSPSTGAPSAGGAIGILTHHLVHDAAAGAFLADLFRTTAAHPGCRWIAATELPVTQEH